MNEEKTREFCKLLNFLFSTPVLGKNSFQKGRTPGTSTFLG